MEKKNTKGNMREAIEKLDIDIEQYRQAVRDAEDALDSAEKELDELLIAIYKEEDLHPVAEEDSGDFRN